MKDNAKIIEVTNALLEKYEEQLDNAKKPGVIVFQGSLADTFTASESPCFRLTALNLP